MAKVLNAFRLEQDIVDWLDEQAASQRRDMPGIRISRADIIRMILAKVKEGSSTGLTGMKAATRKVS